MSRSSLWVMDKEFNGELVEEFSNSWLLTPIVMDVLFQKYMPEKTNGALGKVTFMSASMFDDSIRRDLNNELNQSPNQEDRVLWEIAMQQVFSSKDKKFVAESMKKFLKNNYPLTKEYGEHIHERFNEVADEILSIDESEHPYFLFKGTSVDDSVEYWFSFYDEEEEDYVDRPLSKVDERVTEFVIIENNEIQGFVSNVDFFSTSK